MAEQFLYEKLDVAKEFGMSVDFPEIIKSGLSKKISLREYQIDAFTNFVLYFDNDGLRKNKQVHTLFHMATGSGKTVIMAGLILYLYTKGYRKFLFFVNQTNVLEKTIDNFINPLSNKYLFNDVVEYLGKKVKIKRVENFSGNVLDDDIEILFTTTQKLHMDLFEAKENSLTYDDFENNKVVFISDESHHINSLTKKPTKDEEEVAKSWEYSVTNALSRNRDSIMLEFTATCDLKDTNVLQKYKDKIIFNYPLISFRESGYTKDFQNFATDTDLWERTLMALVMSEYRRFLFADLKLNIKPVVMFKSQKIDESKSFYDEFFKKVKELTSYEIQNLELVGIEKLTEAINYFKEKDDTLELLEQSIKTAFTEDTSIIMNGSSDNNKENQLLVNSLEDLDNPIRLIFAVDMLNEGWDVLNLFDIVRLYDTRQASGKAGKIGSYTIKEAQLIGRGARYCPFVVDDEELKFKRKFDGDISNPNRILETMFFHSKNDSRYISELKNALIETGLQVPDPIILEYRLKDEFKDSDFYKKSYVFSNKRLLKGRDEVHSLEPSMRTKTYYYTALSGKGNIVNLIGGDTANTSTIKTNLKSIKFKDIDYNILLGAIECFEELRFDILKEKYPSLKSMREFLTSDEFLGNSNVEITYSQDEVNGKILFSAVKHALVKVASHVMAIKPEYVGSKEFEPKQLKVILKDKKISLGSIEGNGGKGNSQNNCSNEEYRLDLTNESWYVFNDNYGTSEEKLFVKYFKTNIEPKLKEKNLEYYVVRNERIPELAIYSFEAGERFEPDFLLFVRKQRSGGSLTYQGYVEPKGNQLLENDAWKEAFSMQIEKEHSVKGLFADDYKIIGFPFFNNDNRMEEFEKAIDKWIVKL
ncbi:MULTISPECIES: DEAD/DEAH box helicase family protein [Streptococcus]|uniref:DEAD/DEAH box helicase family protein n=1 Tax=Streptococcus TaxID=1301 RepID=UPI00044760FE|nr:MULTISPECIES: DEAD/DEAH box helicase family protein [Streptococcus]EUC76754.1 type III restriction enzyme, res subunit [Streptococcus sp. CM7]MBT3137572.1 DEAD/DEAH box helicase family protein [Streptococcus parasanguinis]OFL61672.1 type III restriction endonuclease subunit R [Streptococcus sp. HMSC061D01]